MLSLWHTFLSVNIVCVCVCVHVCVRAHACVHVCMWVWMWVYWFIVLIRNWLLYTPSAIMLLLERLERSGASQMSFLTIISLKITVPILHSISSSSFLWRSDIYIYIYIYIYMFFISLSHSQSHKPDTVPQCLNRPKSLHVAGSNPLCLFNSSL